MSRTLMALIAFVIALAIAIYVTNVDGRRIHRFLTLDQIRSRVVADLPVGTTIEQANKYFTNNSVEHSLSPDGKTMGGIITWILGSWIVEVSALIVIHFREGKVERVEVHSEGTFL